MSLLKAIFKFFLIIKCNDFIKENNIHYIYILRPSLLATLQGFQLKKNCIEYSPIHAHRIVTNLIL